MNIEHRCGPVSQGTDAYWALLSHHVNGPDNRWFASIALGRAETSEFERYTHFCLYGGMRWFQSHCCA